MLRLVAGQLDTLWETLLPPAVRVLPDDLARADQVLADPALLEPFRAHWRATCPSGLVDGPADHPDADVPAAHAAQTPLWLGL